MKCGLKWEKSDEVKHCLNRFSMFFIAQLILRWTFHKNFLRSTRERKIVFHFPPRFAFRMASFCSHKKPRKYFKPSQVKSPVASWLNAELMSAESGKWKMWKAFGNKGSDLTVKRLTMAVFPPGDLQSLPNILRRQQRRWTRKKVVEFLLCERWHFPSAKFYCRSV